MNFESMKGNALLVVTSITYVIYLAWRIFYTIPFGYGTLAMIFGITLLLAEIIGAIEAVIHFYNMRTIEYPEKPEIPDEVFPHVDIFIATYNEPRDLLYKTINGCIHMDYPDKSKVHIYLCDDGNRTEMKELCKKMKINYLTRTERDHAKAGNLNNALAHSSSPLVVTFDADMIPMHDFLISCIPYFFKEDEKIGFVQTPQSFYNPDLFQFNLYSENRIPNEQDYFYRDIQVGRNKSNSVIYGGSNTIISREALNEIGGFCTGVITEDFATGVAIQSKGYKCYAISEVHASGLSPADLRSLIKQRERWARGCIQTGRKLNIFFRRGLTFSQRLNYFVSISYWYSPIKRFIYILSPILFSVFGITVVNCSLPGILIFWLPMYILNNMCLKRLSGNIRNSKWTNVYETIMFPSMLPIILLETLYISQKKFAVTRKDGPHHDKKYQLYQAIPHMLLGALSLVGIWKCIVWTFTTGSIGQFVILYWLIMNLYTILMSIFFMFGRNLQRVHERFDAQVQCSINTNNNFINCLTKDISEGGFSIILDLPQYIDPDIWCETILKTDRYEAKFLAKVVHVDQMKDKWKYAFSISKISEHDFDNLLQIVYDRIPTLPQKLDKDISTFEDIRINFLKRNTSEILSNRTLPRFKLNKAVETLEMGTIILKDFNYQYVQIEIPNCNGSSDRLTVLINENITLNCVYASHINNSVNKVYIIENYKELLNNAFLTATLKDWISCSSHESSKSIVVQKNPSYELDEMSFL